MGLTNSSVGTSAIDDGLIINKSSANDMVIALAGNPNVGKSTVFNALTGLNQHTGNWPGKTVANAQGRCNYKDKGYIFVDIPGTYSLFAHSVEEEIARNFICFGKIDAAVVVCDATCLERNLNLVLQIIEATPRVVVCVNLIDEAEKKGIEVDINKLSKILGVPVVSTVARKKKSLRSLLEALYTFKSNNTINIVYPEKIEGAIGIIEPVVSKYAPREINSRWISLRLLDANIAFKDELSAYCGKDITKTKEISDAISFAEVYLNSNGCTKSDIEDTIVSTIVSKSEEISREVVAYKNEKYLKRDILIDKILTGKYTAFPIMLMLLSFIFWLTISAANVPSAYLSDLFLYFQGKLTLFLSSIGVPLWLNSMLIEGGYRVLAWVVAVMLPPMAIFFPLFTILEDVGYLPRIAYNLDKPFKKCNACGKQALTMCMGFGCNAAGIVGCRIIDSPRERLLAILTNNFVPCNGRFPTLIAILSMFFIGTIGGIYGTLLSALLLTFVILIGVFMTFFATKMLSKTLLKGIPSSFTLELPSYRKPQFTQVIIRSVFDRTLFVLGRAAAVAAPVGILIWIMANVKIGEMSILSRFADILDPFAKLMGLDGIILTAFILGFPANEIVIPITIMAYLSSGTLTDTASLTEMHTLFTQNGWTWVTAVSTMLFSLMHWPCSTTLLTIKKETGSIKWTLAAFLIPTVCGIAVCMIFNFIVSIFI